MKYILLITLLFSYTWSAPAFNKRDTFEQRDGMRFIGHPRGDEQSEDGEILKYNPSSKNYELAEIKDDKLRPSGKKYIDGLKKASRLNSSNLREEDVLKLWKKKIRDHRLRMKR